MIIHALQTELHLNQEIYRPGTAISDASNLCTAVGGDQNKEFRGKTSIMRGGGVEIKYIAIVDTNTDYKTKDYLLLESICFKDRRGK